MRLRTRFMRCRATPVRVNRSSISLSRFPTQPNRQQCRSEYGGEAWPRHVWEMLRAALRRAPTPRGLDFSAKGKVMPDLQERLAPSISPLGSEWKAGLMRTLAGSLLLFIYWPWPTRAAFD